ncbi:transcription elongation factor spt5 [Peltigera leucophlebia]|nr:transcription elongation factor spt5 [Peltigera leucophlebia]
MSAIQRPPDFPDDMRDLFEDSEDENAEISGEQSLGPSTQQTSSEPEQADTKRKRSEDETPTSLNDGDQGDLNPIRKKPRQNSDTKASPVLEKVGEKRKRSESPDDPNGAPWREGVENDSEPPSKRTRQETAINEPNSETKEANAASENKSSNEDEVPTAVTNKEALGGKPEEGLKRTVDHTGWAEKEYDSIENSNEDEEEDLSAHRKKRVHLSETHDDKKIDDGEGQDNKIAAQSESNESSDEDGEEIITLKRRRKGPVNQFLDVEAEVSDEEEDDEEEEGEGAEEFNETHPDDDTQLHSRGRYDARGHRALDRQRVIESRIEAERQDKLIKERHQSRQTKKAKVPETISKHLLLPTCEDPQIYMVPCKQGQEKNVVMVIMKKMEEQKIQGRKPPVLSAFERGTTKLLSHVYVEGRKLDEIRLFLQGINNLYLKKMNTTAIPIKEMAALFSMRPTRQLEPGTFVRPKGGLYKGDWAQIDEIDVSKNQVSLRLRPRLEYTASGKKETGLRPVQRLFSAAEAKKGSPENNTVQNLRSVGIQGENHWIFRRETYKDGFLIKNFKVEKLIVTEGQNPTLEEIQKFATVGKDGSASIDLSAVRTAKDTTTRTGGHLIGEDLEAYEDDQKGIRGKVLVSRNGMVTLKITEPEEIAGQNIDIAAKSLRRAFSIGDRIKVVGGCHSDEVGMIVSVKADTVVFMSENHEQLTVFRNDVRVSDDGGVPGGIGKFDMHDLVELNATTVGCIIKVGRDMVHLLDQNGDVISLPPSQVGNKIETKNFAATIDHNGCEIRHGDRVRGVGDDQIEGMVLHIRNRLLFLQNREHMKNSGIFVVPSIKVTLISARDGRPDKRTQGRPGVVQRKENTAMGPPPVKAPNFNRFIGAAVSVRKGPYKGLRGLIRSVDDSSIAVELLAKLKTVRVAYDAIGFVDKNTGESLQTPRGFSAPRRQEGPSSIQPAYNQAQNPTYSGGRTPAWGIAPTNNGSRPAPNDGRRTVNPYAEGSRTSYGDPQTPQWNPSSHTPSIRNPAFDPGSRTPAATSVSRTPAYSGPSTSRTPAWMKASQSSTGSRPLGNALRGVSSSSGGSRYTGTARKRV